VGAANDHNESQDKNGVAESSSGGSNELLETKIERMRGVTTKIRKPGARRAAVIKW